MFKKIFKGMLLYVLILVFVVPAIIIFLFANASRKEMNIQQNVPLPTKEDTIRTFCVLIDTGRISDAVGMMDITDETVKQSWGVYLNNFASFELININKSKIDETGNSFEVDVNVILKKNLTDLPIPNYGWENGLNKRWFNMVKKENGLYKITEIATGP
jgi:hypothetical protein